MLLVTPKCLEIDEVVTTTIDVTHGHGYNHLKNPGENLSCDSTNHARDFPGQLHSDRRVVNRAKQQEELFDYGKRNVS